MCEESGGKQESCEIVTENGYSYVSQKCVCPTGMLLQDRRTCICDEASGYYGDAPDCDYFLTCGDYTTTKGQH